MSTITKIFIDEITSIRQWLHQHPELSFKEFETTKFIREKLASWNLHLEPFHSVRTGGYVDIGKGERPMLGFRADIDALPIDENVNHVTISLNNGIMHACGHDFHTAFGLGLAKYFADNPDDLNGRLRIFFQPAEESIPDGASTIHKENLFNDLTGIFAVHVDLRYQTGQIAVKEGTACASSTLIKLKFNGHGGHTSRPHDTVDLVRISSLYISQITGYLKSIIDSSEDFVLVFGEIHGGHSHNIIPSQLILQGTLRNFDNEVLEVLLKGFKQFTSDFAKIYGCQIQLEIPNSTPAIINDPHMVTGLIDFCNNSKYADRLVVMPKPSMGADDFAYYGRVLPSLYFQIGVDGRGNSHSSDFIVQDTVLKPGLEFLISYIKHFLNKQ